MSVPPLTSENEVVCPLCDRPCDRRFLKYGYGIWECVSCGHQFVADPVNPTHVAQTYGNEYFCGGGAGYPDYLTEGQLLQQQGWRYGKLLQRYTVPGTVLDVGAAAGFILQGLKDSGWQGQGIEPNGAMAEYGRSQLGLDIETGPLEKVQIPDSPQNGFDLVSMIQVVAHFYDLHEALSRASQLTKPGGFWLIETWNRQSWMARLLGSNWHEYSPPSVLRWFSPQDLTAYVSRFGMVQVAIGQPRKFIKGAHAKSLLGYKLKESRWEKWLMPFLHLIPSHVTIPYPAEDLFWVLYQKQGDREPGRQAP